MAERYENRLIYRKVILREVFEEHLAAILRGRASELRQHLFAAWLEGRLFVCERCEDEFEMSANEVDEDDLILCKKCQTVQDGRKR